MSSEMDMQELPPREKVLVIDGVTYRLRRPTLGERFEFMKKIEGIPTDPNKQTAEQQKTMAVALVQTVVKEPQLSEKDFLDMDVMAADKLVVECTQMLGASASQQKFRG